MSFTHDSPAQPSPAEAPPLKALKTCLGQIGSLALVPGTRTSSQSNPSHWPAHRELHPLYPIMGLGKTHLGRRPALLPFFHSDSTVLQHPVPVQWDPGKQAELPSLGSSAFLTPKVSSEGGFTQILALLHDLADAALESLEKTV